MSKKRAFVRYSKQGKIVPGSLILTSGSYPNGPSTWKEVPADLCCDTTIDPVGKSITGKRAFVRYTKAGKIVPGSLIVTNKSFPKGPSTWIEISSNLCCENNTPITTTTTVNPCAEQICGQTFEGYGALYNWYAIGSDNGRGTGGIVNISQPYGDERNEWRVPTDQDWTDLSDVLNGIFSAGGKLKTTCTTPFTVNNGVWESPNTGATNEVNWSAVPGGLRFEFGTFGVMNYYGYWWSSTETSTDIAWSRDIRSDNTFINVVTNLKKRGFSLRLVRPATSAELLLPNGTISYNNPALPHYITNTNAVSLITVKIGNKVWTQQNLSDNRLNDGSLLPEVQDNTQWSNLTTGAWCYYENGAISLNQGSLTRCRTAN